MLTMKEKVKIIIGYRIKQLRLKMGLSQEKFALKIDMDRSYFASVESGKRNISIENLEKIILGLEIDFKTFFEDMKEGK